MIMMLAGLQTVPDQLHRAAMVDGAGPWQRFWHVTMPHLKGVTLVTVLLMLVANLNSFTIPWIMTGGGPAGASRHLDHADLPAGLRPHPLRHRVRLLGHSLHRDDGDGLLLRPRADARRRAAGRMSVAATRARRTRRRRPDGWGIAAWVFLTLLLLFAILPMVWMLVTSLKTQFAALQYPPELDPEQPHARAVLDAAVAEQRCRARLPSLHVEQHLGLDGDDGAGRSRGRAGGLRLLALPLSRAEVALLRRAAAQHVPGGRVPDAALHDDALAAGS